MKTSTIPDSLQEVLNSLEFEEWGWLRVTAATWYDRECTLDVRLSTGMEADPVHTWRVRCTQLRDSHVTAEVAYDIELHVDHPLLLAVKEPHVTLSFKGGATDPYAVLGRLWEQHHEVMGDWTAFETYLNPGTRLAELLRSGGGVFASGPRLLLERYADVLEHSGLESSLHGDRPAKRWEQNEWVEEDPNVRLLLVGGTYLIAGAFDFRLLEERR